MPSSHIRKPDTRDARAWVMPKRSSVQATTGAKLPMHEVIAAAISSRKKTLAKRLPAGSMPKATGSVWNTSPSPALGAMPCWNTSGNMAKPANRATPVSAPTTIKAFCVIEVLRSR